MCDVKPVPSIWISSVSLPSLQASIVFLKKISQFKKNNVKTQIFDLTDV